MRKCTQLYSKYHILYHNVRLTTQPPRITFGDLPLLLVAIDQNVAAKNKWRRL